VFALKNKGAEPPRVCEFSYRELGRDDLSEFDELLDIKLRDLFVVLPPLDCKDVSDDAFLMNGGLESDLAVMFDVVDISDLVVN
jgi:hypothetical protein